MELPCNTMYELPPPLRGWSQNAGNRCAWHDIMSQWTVHDAVTFLVDPKGYHPTFHDFLTPDEKEQVLRLKPEVSRQRFVVSRTALKHILQKILQKKTTADIVLGRNEHGRILVKDHPSIYICLSYSGTHIAVTVGKQKLGSDIEIVRPLNDKKITGGSVFAHFPPCRDEDRIRRVIHVWTLVESYAKLYDKNPYPILNDGSFFSGAAFISYDINSCSIFSLAFSSGQLSDALVWLDMSCLQNAGHQSSGTRNGVSWSVSRAIPIKEEQDFLDKPGLDFL